MQIFDVEKFIKHWWSPAVLSTEAQEHILHSYQAPDLFWNTLFDFNKGLAKIPCESQLNKNYNFYHDCILRHIWSNEVAFRIINEKGDREEWTYKKIHQCINANVRIWSNFEPLPGQSIVIVLKPGIKFILTLFTALRFGLTICFLPSESPFFALTQIDEMLKEISPNFMIIEGNYPSTTSHLTIDIDAQDEEEYLPHSHSYEASAVVQASLALSQQNFLEIVPVKAHVAYLHALRDGLIPLNLRQNICWSAPLACPVCTEPCSTLMSFLCGATLVHVSEENLTANPALIKDEKIHFLGFSENLIELWSKGSFAPLRYLKGYYRKPFALNSSTWKAFLQENKMEKSLGFQVLMDNAQGGFTLLSKPMLEIDYFLKPNFGVEWQLMDIENPEKSALNSYGIFQSNSILSNLTFNQIDTNLFLCGSVKPSSEGVTYPKEEVEMIISKLPFVEDCILLSFQKMGVIASHLFHLLVFVNPLHHVSEKEKIQWKSEISNSITNELGKGFLPDRIEFFSLLPKKNLDGIDRVWCERQYKQGSFTKKMERPAYQICHILKKLASQAGLKDG